MFLEATGVCWLLIMSSSCSLRVAGFFLADPPRALLAKVLGEEILSWDTRVELGLVIGRPES